MKETFNIVDLFFEAAKKHPNKLAIVDANERVSFGELAKLVLDTAGFFQKKGIKEGDRVLIFVPMGLDLYRIVLAIFKLGASAVFLDEWVSKKRLDACCKVADCSAFIAIPKVRLLSFLSRELRKIPIKLGLSYSAEDYKNSTYTTLEDTALITFTTGSTGKPKAAKRTHGFLNEQFNALIEKIEPKESEIDMPALPIVLLINLGAGCTSVIPVYKASKPEKFRPEQVIQQWKEEQVNRFVSSPFLVKQLANHIIKFNIDCPNIQKIFTGGAPVFPKEAEIYNKAFPQAKIEIVYGSTEAEPISSIDSRELVKQKDQLLEKGLNVGKPYRKTEVKIIRISDECIICKNEDDFNQLEIKGKDIGEIIVSGPHVLQQYFNNEEAIKRNKIFVSEKCWHRTGDSGYLENGNLYLTGRCSTLIKRQDKLISPFIYENFFQTIAGVEIGTIISKDQKIIAVIEKNDSFRNELFEIAMKNQELVIDEFRWIKKIPRDPRHNSKIDYQKLTTSLR